MASQALIKDFEDMMQLEDVLSHNHDSVRVKHTIELYAESLK